MKIGIVEYDFEEIVNEWVREDCREEAKEIIKHMLKWDTRYTYVLLIEFIIYHEKGMGNIVCCHLDLMKSKLVEFGKMKPEGCFGSPFIDLDELDLKVPEE
jgi:hypothetical protein